MGESGAWGGADGGVARFLARGLEGEKGRRAGWATGMAAGIHRKRDR